MIRNKVIGKEVSLHFLSPQCFMQIQQIRKKVSSQEGSGGSKIADTDKAQNGQSVSSVQLSVIDKNGPAIALVTKPPVSH